MVATVAIVNESQISDSQSGRDDSFERVISINSAPLLIQVFPMAKQI
jgi:hypothetical protein